MAIVTLCFVKYRDKILMINRNKSPFMGMWNAVGGHLESGEEVDECAKREIFEESGIKVSKVDLYSVSTWNYDDDLIYVYLSVLDDSIDISRYPIKMKEGIIDFLDIDWVIDEKNYGIVPDLRLFIKDIKNKTKHNYHLIYDESRLVDFIIKE